MQNAKCKMQNEGSLCSEYIRFDKDEKQPSARRIDVFCFNQTFKGGFIIINLTVL